MVKDRFTKQLWIGLGIVIVSIAAAALAIFFFVGNLTTQADTIEQDRALIQKQTDSVANLASLEHAVPQAAQYQTAMDQLLPDQYGLVTFEQWFSQAGRRYNVTSAAQFLGAAASPQGTTPGTAGFSFDAEGSPADLIRFLDGINMKSAGFLISLSTFSFTNTNNSAKVMGQGIIFFR
jgi:type II secretory pathway pseudopilin PulG